MTFLRKKQKTLSALSTPRWSAYAAAGAASALACAGSAEAMIHDYAVNQTFNAPVGSNTHGSFALANGAATLTINQGRRSTSAGSASVHLGNSGGAGHNVGINGFTHSGSFYASKLAAGASIAKLPFVGNFAGTGLSQQNARGELASSGGRGNSQWLQPGQGYVGFEFNAGNGEQYGWVSITMDSGAPIDSVTVNSYAYGDPGDVVTAGEVPEPGSLGLLAVGGAGLLAWRKRRARF